MSISRSAQSRLQKEYRCILGDPIENIEVRPLESDLLFWYFLIDGPINTPFEGGKYFGVIRFQPNYPYDPPDFIMHTPNGKFQVDYKICLSYSGYHKESWNPLWSVSSMLIGLVSFMTSYEYGAGCIESTDATKQQLSRESHLFNSKHPICSTLFQ